MINMDNKVFKTEVHQEEVVALVIFLAFSEVVKDKLDLEKLNQNLLKSKLHLAKYIMVQ
jgi:hypothetical protein